MTSSVFPSSRMASMSGHPLSGGHIMSSEDTYLKNKNKDQRRKGLGIERARSTPPFELIRTSILGTYSSP